MSNLISVLREHQYKEISELTLTGKVLDLGGSKKSGYQELIKGEHTFTVVNFGDLHPGADLVFNAEEKFPLENISFENVLAMNFLEHIYNYHNVFAEVSRILKSGGLFVANTPFMHHIHGSPNDYHRYTEQTYRKLAEQYGFDMILIKPLGYGLFSLIFQTITIYKTLPWPWLFNTVKFIFTTIDKILLAIPYYRKLANTIPLGYFWVMKKK